MDPAPNHPSLAEPPILIDLYDISLRIVGSAVPLAIAGLGPPRSAGRRAAPPRLSRPASAAPAGLGSLRPRAPSAPATPASLAHLDGGRPPRADPPTPLRRSTRSNTGRTADVNGAAIPGVISANGFPAYANWPGGCSATVATLFQPNMWVITTALRSGAVPTCGVPRRRGPECVVRANGGPAALLRHLPIAAAATLPASLPVSPALDVYGNVTADLQSYQLAISAVTAQ